MQDNLGKLVELMKKTGHYRYLLVDALKPLKETNLLSIDNISLFFDNEKNHICPVLRPEISYDPAHCPQLILLAFPHEEVNINLLSLSLKQANEEIYMQKRYVCGWFASDLPPEDLSIQLVTIGKNLAEKVSNYNNGFLPYFEPFRMQLLHEGNQIYSKWLPIQLKGICQYTYLSLGRKIKIIENDDQADLSLLGFSQLSDRASIYQQHAKQIFLCIKAYLDINQIDTLNDKQLISIINRFEEAISIGLRDIKDQYSYVLNSLTLDIDLMNHLITKNIVLNAVSNTGSLQQNLAAITKSQWDELK